MAKSKYSPALFEVINRQKTAKSAGKLSTPKWWKSLANADSAPTEVDPDAPVDAAESGPAVPDSDMPSPEAAVEPGLAAALVAGEGEADRNAADFSGPGSVSADKIATSTSELTYGPRAESRPMLRIENGRIELSMNTLTAGALAALLVMALLVSYGLGRSGRSSEAQVTHKDDLTNAIEQPAKPSVLNVGGAEKPASPTGKATENAAVSPPIPPPAGDLKAGYHYVILDSYPKDARDSAYYVRKWLAQKHGIQAVLKVKGSMYLLIATTPFDYKLPGEQDKCQQFIERIKALGPECRKELIREKLLVYGFASPLAFQFTE